MSTLPSYRAKLVQAQRHLNLLRTMSDSLPNSDAYAVYVERDSETGEIIVYGEPRRETPMLTWGVVIGDIVHNLRSALDHIVWQLAVQRHDPPPEISGKWRKIAFPVFTEDLREKNKFGNRIPWRDKPPDQLWKVDTNLLAEFERLQPFMHEKRQPHACENKAVYHPLAILNEMWNIDKHRHLHLSVFRVGYKDLFDPHLPIPKGINRLNFALNPKGSFEGRTEFGRLSWDGGPVPPEIARRLKPTVFFDIVFADGPPAYGGQVIETLDFLSEEVRNILQRFEPHLV